VAGDADAGDEDAEDDEENHNNNISSRMFTSRTRFTEIIQSIVKQSVGGEMLNDFLLDVMPPSDSLLALHIGGTLGPLTVEMQKQALKSACSRCNPFVSAPPSKEEKEEVQPLKSSVQTQEVQPRSCCCCCRRKPKKEKKQGLRNYLNGLSNEAYMKTRVKPLLKDCNLKSPRLSCMYNVLNLMVILSSSVATVLGALEFQTWVPVAVSAGTVFASLQEHYMFQQRLAATSTAAGDLNALVVFWESLGPVSRRMMTTRHHLVAVTERAASAIATAVAGGITSLHVDDEAEALEQPVKN